MRGRIFGPLAIVIALGAMAAGGIVISQPGGSTPPSAGTANIWIEVGAGTCTGGRSATPIAYADSASPDRRCGTIDAAWDAMNSGDTARMRDGNYPPQCLSGSKTSNTKVIGEDGVVIGNGGTFECVAVFGGDSTVGVVSADYFWLEDVELDAGDEASIGGNVRVFTDADNVTLTNVDSIGDFSYNYIDGNNFTYNGGELWQSASPPQEVCGAGGGNTFWILGDNATIENVNVGIRNRQDIPTPNQNGCGPDGLPHLENIRNESADGMVIRNTYWAPGSEVGSGHIYTSGGNVTGVKLINNYWGANGDGIYWAQISQISGWVIAYNTINNDLNMNTSSGMVWVGNLGISQGCGGTQIRNVWAGSGSCQTNTFTGGSLASLGINAATGLIASNSPAVGNGEVPSASDYCTNPAYVDSRDRLGDVRPQGSACDAGSDEYSEPGGTANIWVDGSGSCDRTVTEVAYATATACDSLNSAYQEAAPGDLIRIKDGDYGDETVANRSGMSASVVEFAPAAGETPTFQDIEWNASYVSFAGDISFKTLNIGSRDETPAYRVTNVTFDGITVDHEDSTEPTRRAMILSATDNVTISNFEIGNTMAGANIGEDSNLVHTWGGSSTFNTNLTFTSGRFYENDSPASTDAHNECMYLPDVAPLTITDNVFETCTFYGIFMTDFNNGGIETSDNLIIRNNEFRAGKFPGGSATYYWGISFHGNINDTPGTNSVIEYNTIENGLSLGFTGTSGLTVRGNIIGTGAWIDDASSGQCRTGVTFTRNVMPTNCGSTNTTATEGTIRASWTSVNTTWGAAEDFELLAGAAALGAGDTANFPATDLDGVTRVSPPDAGAYERP